MPSAPCIEWSPYSHANLMLRREGVCTATHLDWPVLLGPTRVASMTSTCHHDSDSIVLEPIYMEMGLILQCGQLQYQTGHGDFVLGQGRSSISQRRTSRVSRFSLHRFSFFRGRHHQGRAENVCQDRCHSRPTLHLRAAKGSLGP